MGKKLIKYLIVFLALAICSTATARKSFAQKEAGSSASISAAIIKSDAQNLNLKRKVLHDMFVKYNSPFVTEVDAFIDACTKYNIDCYLLPSIAGLESSFGRFTYPGSHNPFGWGGGYIMFDSWAACFDAVAKGIRQNYIDTWHVDTIYEMAPIYAESKTWAPRVSYFHDQFEMAEKAQALYFQNLEVEW